MNETTVNQKFKFYRGSNLVYEYSSELENLSIKHHDIILQIMKDYIRKCELDESKRYVAIGNAGDVVIYENGGITQLSDSF
jgi:hypothetical protein